MSALKAILPYLVLSLCFVDNAKCNVPVPSDTMLSGFLPTEWEEFQKREIPKWYKDARFGIYFNWQIGSTYDVDRSKSTWQKWFVADSSSNNLFMAEHFRPNITLPEFEIDFNAEFYDPKQLVQFANQSCARYVVMTAKHDDGFAFWNSIASNNWNAFEMGPNAYLLEQFRDEAKKKGIKLGVSYAFNEPRNPLLQHDMRSGWKTKLYVDTKLTDEVKDLISSMRPDIFWSEVPNNLPSAYLKSRDLVNWIINHSIVRESIVLTEEWGGGSGLSTAGIKVFYSPDEIPKASKDNKLPFEVRSNMHMKGSWYRPDAMISDIKTSTQVVIELIKTISHGGNYVIGVPLAPHGRIPALYEERLRELGSWIRTHETAIFNTLPYYIHKDSRAEVWYTLKRSPRFQVFAFVVGWPRDNELNLSFTLKERADITVCLLPSLRTLKWKRTDTGIIVNLPDLDPTEMHWPPVYVLDMHVDHSHSKNSFVKH